MTSFMGKILRVDLSARTAEAVSIPPEVYEAVLAGNNIITLSDEDLGTVL